MAERLHRYRVIRALGSGGMAFVCLAERADVEDFRRPVALKVLHPHLANERELVRQFIHEARIAARIRHPRVVAVLDAEREGDLVYLVMDYVDGISMAELLGRLGRASVPLRVGLRVLCDALEGLEAAHGLTDEEGKPLDIVHRDVTPQNILISRAGIAYLADFGIAKSAASTLHTRDGVVKGKVSYMAPEQVRGRAVDRRVDVWAAGVVAWELIAQRKLFAGDDVSVLMSIVTKRPPRLSRVVPDVGPALERTVDWALARTPDRRCPTARALRDGIEEALAAAGGLASDAEVAAYVAEALQLPDRSVAERDELVPLESTDVATLASTRRMRPRRRLVAIASAAVLGAAAATAAQWWSRVPEDRQLMVDRFVGAAIASVRIAEDPPREPAAEPAADARSESAQVTPPAAAPRARRASAPPVRRERTSRPLLDSPYEDR